MAEDDGVDTDGAEFRHDIGIGVKVSRL
jgi:hypothetical protein